MKIFINSAKSNRSCVLDTSFKMCSEFKKAGREISYILCSSANIYYALRSKTHRLSRCPGKVKKELPKTCRLADRTTTGYSSNPFKKIALVNGCRDYFLVLSMMTWLLLYVACIFGSSGMKFLTHVQEVMRSNLGRVILLVSCPINYL